MLLRNMLHITNYLHCADLKASAVASWLVQMPVTILILERMQFKHVFCYKHNQFLGTAHPCLEEYALCCLRQEERSRGKLNGLIG